jgi:hypothetical protein
VCELVRDVDGMPVLDLLPFLWPVDSQSRAEMML